MAQSDLLELFLRSSDGRLRISLPGGQQRDNTRYVDDHEHLDQRKPRLRHCLVCEVTRRAGLLQNRGRWVAR